MLATALIVLAVVFLVLGFVHVVALLLGIGVAVACVVALLIASSGSPFSRRV